MLQINSVYYAPNIIAEAEACTTVHRGTRVARRQFLFIFPFLSGVDNVRDSVTMSGASDKLMRTIS